MKAAGSINDAPDLLGILDYEISVLAGTAGRHTRRAQARAERDGEPHDTAERMAQWAQLRLARLRLARVIAEQLLQGAHNGGGQP